MTPLMSRTMGATCTSESTSCLVLFIAFVRSSDRSSLPYRRRIFKCRSQSQESAAGQLPARHSVGPRGRSLEREGGPGMVRGPVALQRRAARHRRAFCEAFTSEDGARRRAFRPVLTFYVIRSQRSIFARFAFGN